MPKEKGEGERKGGAESLKAEGDEEWLKENEPNVAFKHMATFRSHKKAKKEPLNYVDTRMNGGSVQPELASPRRSGKSTQLIMLKKNKWWCNYTGQDTVVIEEADPKNMEHLADRLKVWADLSVPRRDQGRKNRRIRPLKVIVTSNYTPEECFPTQ